MGGSWTAHERTAGGISAAQPASWPPGSGPAFLLAVCYKADPPGDWLNARFDGRFAVRWPHRGADLPKPFAYSLGSRVVPFRPHTRLEKEPISLPGAIKLHARSAAQGVGALSLGQASVRHRTSTADVGGETFAYKILTDLSPVARVMAEGTGQNA